jgi:hypothetical protein
MPCYEIQTTRVALDLSDRALLKAALDKLVEAEAVRVRTHGGQTYTGTNGRGIYYVREPGGRIASVNVETGIVTASGYQSAAVAAAVRNHVARTYTHVVIEAACNEFGIALEASEEPDTYLTAGL